jgi:hypothetical protein
MKVLFFLSLRLKICHVQKKFIKNYYHETANSENIIDWLVILCLKHYWSTELLNE